MMQDLERVLLTEEQIKTRVAELGKQISQEYAGKTPIFVGVLKGVVVYFADMIRAVDIPCEIDFMCMSSYAGTQSQGKINVRLDLSRDIAGRHVVILEDILDTGRTLKKTVEYLQSKHPASLKICTFLDKPDRRVADIQADYVGYTIPDLFVVGYGLDYNEAYRNLPFIGVLKPEAYNE